MTRHNKSGLSEGGLLSGLCKSFRLPFCIVGGSEGGEKRGREDWVTEVGRGERKEEGGGRVV